jgi:hypothetical protein
MRAALFLVTRAAGASKANAGKPCYSESGLTLSALMLRRLLLVLLLLAALLARILRITRLCIGLLRIAHLCSFVCESSG